MRSAQKICMLGVTYERHVHATVHLPVRVPHKLMEVNSLTTHARGQTLARQHIHERSLAASNRAMYVNATAYRFAAPPRKVIRRAWYRCGGMRVRWRMSRRGGRSERVSEPILTIYS